MSVVSLWWHSVGGGLKSLLSFRRSSCDPDHCDVHYLAINRFSLSWAPTLERVGGDWSRLVGRSEWKAGNHSYLPHLPVENMPSLTLMFFGACCCQAVVSWQLCRRNKRPIRPKMICKQWRRSICRPVMSDRVKKQRHVTCGWHAESYLLKCQLLPYARGQENVLLRAEFGFLLTLGVLLSP